MNNNMNNNINQTVQEPKKKSRRKFNIIDFIILVLVIAIIGGSIYAIVSWSNLKNLWLTESVELVYTVEFRGVDEDFIDNINSGETVTNSISKSKIGEVVNVESVEKHAVLDYKAVPVKDEEGNIVPDVYTYSGVLSEYPDKYDITVYISSKAEYKKGEGYTIDGRRIAVGEALELRFPKFSAIGYCVSVEIKETK